VYESYELLLWCYWSLLALTDITILNKNNSIKVCNGMRVVWHNSDDF